MSDKPSPIPDKRKTVRHRLATAALLAQFLMIFSACQPMAEQAPESAPASVTDTGAATATRSRAVRLERIVDGDTIVVRERSGKKLRIRLAGIDAPEMKQSGGKAAREHLKGQLKGQELRLRGHKKDRYGRLVATVMAGQRNANLDLVNAGMAWFYRRYKKELTPAERTAYDRAEQRARRARRGLWKASDPEPPWQYRSRKRKKR